MSAEDRYLEPPDDDCLCGRHDCDGDGHACTVRALQSAEDDLLERADAARKERDR